jgi:predicted SAM-dependent methyltransferase
MKYLNLGCGFQYSTQPEWTNLDFVSRGEGVIAHNLMNGIPFESKTFDLVYHSHLLEHFSKEDGDKFINECFRVLRPGGIIRIAVPDLEQIVRNYLKYLETGLNNPGDKTNAQNYEWILLEMYDQTVRNYSGGNMAKYLYQDIIPNEDFVFERLGEEARGIRNSYLLSKNKTISKETSTNLKKHSQSFVERFKSNLKRTLLKRWAIDEAALAIGKFRLGGEIHQWMYDRYSLSNLLKSAGSRNIQIKDAFKSAIPNWSDYNLDGKNLITRKPDSLFIEAVK